MEDTNKFINEVCKKYKQLNKIMKARHEGRIKEAESLKKTQTEIKLQLKNLGIQTQTSEVKHFDETTRCGRENLSVEDKIKKQVPQSKKMLELGTTNMRKI